MKIIEKIARSVSDKENNNIPCIAFLGDSITEGCFNGYQDRKEGYACKLQSLLLTVFPSANINIINAGIGGTTAPFGSERIERDIISKNPDLCVVCFGLNDAPSGEEGLKKYTDALSAIFNSLSKAGIEAVFMTPNMMCKYSDEKVIDPIYLEYAKVVIKIQNDGIMDKYMEAAKDTAKKHNVMICDCYSKWKKMEEYGIDTTKLLSNGINHPIPKMHDLFAHSLFEILFK